MQLPPRFHGSVGFNAQHSPMGALASFTLGHANTSGGLGAERGSPGTQDVYIGWMDAPRGTPADIHVLPFYKGAGDAVSAQAFTVGQLPPDDARRARLRPIDLKGVSRHYGWGTDSWVTGPLRFTVFSPFGAIPDPASGSASELREALLPAVVAELTLDNSTGKTTRTAVFALRFTEPGVHVLPGGLGRGRAGFALRRHMGAAAEVDAGELTLFQRFGVEEGLTQPQAVHQLGACAGVLVEVPAGQTRTIRIALGVYLANVVTTGLDGKYLYTRYYGDITEVLAAALDRFDELRSRCLALDAELEGSGLSADQKFLIAHATRSYYGSTQLLDIGGQPWWVVNEGEYVMINTLDLSVDHVFWELRHNPWVVKNLLENYERCYSYRDSVKDPVDGKLHPGGISFTHDQGAHNQFSPLRHSSYELSGLTGCFSQMTQEQLCNWSLMAACYFAATGDREFLEQHAHTLAACLASMLNRDHWDPSRRKGMMQMDSSRCGSGQEITTYDSLDHSLAQARNNLYIAVKCLATYLGLGLMLENVGDRADAVLAYRQAELAAQTVVAQASDTGWLPAVFEKDNPGHASRIIPAVEGLIYPLYCARQAHGKALAAFIRGDGPMKSLLAVLGKHLATLLGDEQKRSKFLDGGWRLSSTSGNSWISKIAICQHVGRVLFGLEKGDAAQRAADAAHAKWLVEGASAYWAMSDQIVDGVARGSKYYPRCVTTALWLEE